MGSFVALHIRERESDVLVDSIGEWLRAYGFGAAARLHSVPGAFHAFRTRTDAVGLGRLNEHWLILQFNGFTLGGRFIDENVVRPVAARLATRTVLFTGQTTSDTYQLVVLEGSARLRSVAWSDGECLTEGQHLPGERPGAFSIDPAAEGAEAAGPFPLQDAEAVCSAMGFELWPTAPLTGPVIVWRRRGLLSRVLGK